MPTRVYWANSFFSEADRRFNARCVRRLRNAGYEVFNPQESKYNELVTTDAAAITKGDMRAIRKAAVLVACIDQESIDPGVACEVGFAYALRKPIIGLFTDIRQRRIDHGRIYKNPLVVGCILERGKVLNTMTEVVKAVGSVRRT